MTIKFMIESVPSEQRTYVELTRVPVPGEEIHWTDRIVKIDRVIHFAGPVDNGPVAMAYVYEPVIGGRQHI